MTGTHPLAYTAPYGFHQLSCHVTSSRVERHNNRTLTLKKHLDLTKVYSTAASYNLHSSSQNQKQIDLQLDSTFHAPMSLSVDTTVSIAHLPSYLSTVASGTATALYNLRASAKITKHAPGCAEHHARRGTLRCERLGPERECREDCQRCCLDPPAPAAELCALSGGRQAPAGFANPRLG